jgi:tol-pal system protein YbgF
MKSVCRLRRDCGKFFGIMVLFIACTIISCATKRNVIELRDEIVSQNTETQSRLLSLETSVSVLDSLLREQNNVLQGIRAYVGTQTQDQRENIALISARQDDISYQLGKLLEKLQAIQLYGGVEKKPQKESTLSPSATPPPSTPSPQATASSDTTGVEGRELYDSAINDFMSGNYPLAESQFLSFIMQYPNHELAVDAQFFLAESAYGQKKYDVAISEYQKVIKNYPKSSKIPEAMLKIGFSQLELGQKQSGTKILTTLIKSFPKTAEAKRARQVLKSQ